MMFFSSTPSTMINLDILSLVPRRPGSSHLYEKMAVFLPHQAFSLFVVVTCGICTFFTCIGKIQGSLLDIWLTPKILLDASWRKCVNLGSNPWHQRECNFHYQDAVTRGPNNKHIQSKNRNKFLVVNSSSDLILLLNKKEGWV